MRLFDHVMEHLYCRAERWYHAAPHDLTEETVADTVCNLFGRYDGHVYRRYERKRVAAWDTVLALFKGA